MRSRYTAFTRGEVIYLRDTQAAPTRELTWEETEKWAKSVPWLSLTIVAKEAGGEGDDTGIVEFIARYLESDGIHALHERSSFDRVGEERRWRYASGKPDATVTKVERNAPCPCGSGKKFKACHACFSLSLRSGERARERGERVLVK